MNYLINTTAHIFFVNAGLHFGDNLQEISADAVSPVELCASLNATVSQMMFNTEGRGNFGGGLMKIQTYEIQNLRIVNPTLLSGIDVGAFASANWDVLTPSAERRQLDAAVFDALELTQGEREAVYEGVSELVGNRIRRARSV